MADQPASPALQVGPHAIVATGGWLKVARIFDHEWREDDPGDVASLISRVEAHRFDGRKADLFTFAERLPRTEPRFPYPTEWDSIAAIRITTFDDWWRNAISTNTRKNIRKAVKREIVTRVVAFDDDLLRGIVDINDESPLRQGRPFAHYRESRDLVRRGQATYLERSVFIGAYWKTELVGFMKIVDVGGVAGVMQLVTKTSQNGRRPANALISAAVRHCAAAGMSHLAFGRLRYGKKRTSSLAEFKRRNGFEEVLVPRYYVPLTAKGVIALRLGLHRGLVGIVPETLLDLLRTVRRRWFEARLSPRANATSG
jgi:hypothetical protein